MRSNGTRLALAALWSSLLTLGTVAQTNVAQTNVAQRVDSLAAPYLESNVVNSMVIGVIKNGETVVRGYGSITPERDQAPDQDTVFEIGSMSKVFTGILLGDAVVRGLVTLDEPASELLPTGVTMPSWEGQVITLKQLATHTSGLPRLPDNMPFGNPANPYADYSPELLHTFLKGHVLRRAPGTESEYSNLAVGLLGTLLAQREETTYAELLKNRITQPLEMTSTTIELTPELQSRLAPPHTGERLPASNWDIPTLAGAGGIRSTVRDLMKFAQAQLEPPAGELGQAIQLAWEVQQPPLTPENFAMGLGWHIARDGTTRFHNGQTGGYHSMLFASRQFSAAVVILSNTATGEIDVLAEDIIRMLAGAEVQPRVFESVTVAPEIMQRYVGQYAIVPQFVLTVRVEGDKLMVGATGQPTFQVYPRSETEWYYKVVDATLTFQCDDEGKCHALDLFQNGVHQAAKRVE